MKNNYYEKNKEKILQKMKERYSNDEEYRNMVKEKYRNRYHEDEDYRKSTVERSKRKYRIYKNVIQKSQAS